MSNVANKTTISIELDQQSLNADIAEASRVLGDFFQQMQQSANIAVRLDRDLQAATGRVVLKVDVDPESATAGLEVIQNHVKDFAAQMRSKAKIVVGVDTQPVRTAFTQLRDYAVRTGSSIADGMYFWISRGLLKIGRDLLKSPFTAFAAAFSKGIEAEESTKKLTKALGATGEQSGKTVEELAAYARQLEKVTNVANEATQGVQALLAPSKGLTGVNFDRATKGALDLAAALGGDINSHAERLAKSLQDPVRGMEMLRDAGISFTQEQQDIIKLFSETNRVGDAQSIMLDELESRYLGAADSTGDLSDKVKQAELHYENFKERIGEVIVEMKSEFIPAIDEAMAKLDGLTPVAAGAATALANIAISILNLRDNTDAATMSTEEIALKTSEWASALEAGYGSLGGTADRTISNLEDMLMLVTQMPGYITNALGNAVTGGSDEFEFGFTDITGAKARLDKSAAELEEAAIERRKKTKDRLKTESEDRIREAKKRREDQEKEIALGTGLVTQDEIDKKGAKQAIKDARETQQAERKKLLEQDAAIKKAAEDADRAARRAARAAQDADDDKARADKRAARDAEAAEDKRMKEEERARAKAQADYEKSLGRDSLLAMHDRIQDGAFLLRGDLEEKQKITTASRTVDKKSQEDKKAAKELGPGKANSLGVALPPTKAARDAAEVSSFLEGFMPNTRKATNALGQKTAPTQKQKDAAEQEAFLAGFAPRGKAGSTKLEVKQDDVVQAVDKTEKAINTIGNNIVKAIKEPTKMGP